jgi:hypothetical protein
VIAQLAADLLAKVQTVPALALSAGLSLGGRSADPGLLKVPVPAAWITFKQDGSDQQSYEHGNPSGFETDSPLMMMTWCVTVLMPYIDDADLLTTQYPLLEAVILAVAGTESGGGFNWRYAGQRIALVYPDRLAYEQRYTVDYVPQ